MDSVSAHQRKRNHCAAKHDRVLSAGTNERISEVGEERAAANRRHSEDREENHRVSVRNNRLASTHRLHSCRSRSGTHPPSHAAIRLVYSLWFNHSQNNHSRTHRIGTIASARRRNLPVFVLSPAGLRSEAICREQGDVRSRRRGFLAGRVQSDPAEHAEHSGRMLGGHKAAIARAIPGTRTREQSRWMGICVHASEWEHLEDKNDV